MLPVGGIKEKLMAARRAGVKSVIIPGKNAADIEDLDMVIRKDLDIITVEGPKEIIERALVSER